MIAKRPSSGSSKKARKSGCTTTKDLPRKWSRFVRNTGDGSPPACRKSSTHEKHFANGKAPKSESSAASRKQLRHACRQTALRATQALLACSRKTLVQRRAFGNRPEFRLATST